MELAQRVQDLFASPEHGIYSHMDLKHGCWAVEGRPKGGPLSPSQIPWARLDGINPTTQAATTATAANMPTIAVNMPAAAVDMFTAVDEIRYQSLPHRAYHHLITGAPGHRMHRRTAPQSQTRAGEGVETPSPRAFGIVGTLYLP